MSHADDLATRILDTVHEQLSIDEPWTERRGDRFTWWPGAGVRRPRRRREYGSN